MRSSNARLTLMRSLSKRLTKNVLARMGYELRKTPQPEAIPVQEFGIDPMKDMLRLTHLSGLSSRTVVFDIGAHVGDTVREFSFVFGNPLIHAFEPSPKTFETLKANTSYIPAITLNNVGLGSSRSELFFHESEKAEMNSFLAPAKDCWIKPQFVQKLPVRTVDDYCLEHSIRRIDVLKSDTQGYDLEVLRGAESMLTSGRVRLVYLEIIFSEMYSGLPSLDEIYRYLCDRGFGLVTFYKFYYQHNRAGWTDALFACDK
jgi:FkbM family methyltransferase